MASWPELDELKQVLDVDGDQWDGDDYEDLTRLSRLLAAAIARVKIDVGHWDEYEDEPDDALASAALRMAELMAQRPGVVETELGADPAYRAYFKGHRRVFGIA